MRQISERLKGATFSLCTSFRAVKLQISSLCGAWFLCESIALHYMKFLPSCVQRFGGEFLEVLVAVRSISMPHISSL